MKLLAETSNSITDNFISFKKKKKKSSWSKEELNTVLKCLTFDPNKDNWEKSKINWVLTLEKIKSNVGFSSEFKNNHLENNIALRQCVSRLDGVIYDLKRYSICLLLFCYLFCFILFCFRNQCENIIEKKVITVEEDEEEEFAFVAKSRKTSRVEKRIFLIEEDDEGFGQKKLRLPEKICRLCNKRFE
jgi:hypothetical protein